MGEEKTLRKNTTLQFARRFSDLIPCYKGWEGQNLYKHKVNARREPQEVLQTIFEEN